MAQTKQIIFPEIIAYLALLFAAFVYAFYREPNTYFTFLIQKILAKEWQSHNFTDLHSSYTWVIFSLPSGLWVMASTIFGNFLRKKSSIFVYLPIILVLGIEFLQFLNITDGFFDILDIMVSILGFLFAQKFRFFIPQPQKRWYIAYGICILAVPLSDVMK